MAKLPKGWEDLPGVEVIDPVRRSKRFSLLLYGHSGTGKTSLAASTSKVPELSPVLYIDTEDGTVPLPFHGDLNNLTVIRVTNYAGFLRLMGKLKATLEKGETLPYRTIVVDTISRLQEMIREGIQSQDPTNGFAAWDAVYNLVSQMIAILSDAGISFICTTHEERVADADGVVKLLGPSFEGKKSITKLPSRYDLVGRTFKAADEEDDNKTIYAVAFDEPSDEMITKARWNSLPSAYGNPTMGRIYADIVDAVDKATDTYDTTDTDTN